MHRLILLSVLLIVSAIAVAQIDSTENFDYSKFGDAEGVKRFCNQMAQ